jgi:hypothetical protein
MAITLKIFRETRLKCWTKYAWGGDTVVEHSPSHPKVEGLSPATTSGTKVKMAKSWNCNYFISLHLHSTCINKQGHTVNNLVELKLVKLWVSLSHWTYAQIIFPTSFADQKGGGVLIRLLHWLNIARTPANYFFIYVRQTPILTICVLM